jgi:hypothetical protein
VPILNNTNFSYSINREKKNFDQLFFGDACDYHVLANLTWEKLTENFIFRSRRDIRQFLGITMNADQYEKLKSSYANAHRKYYSAGDKILTLHDFFAGIKKGSRKLRTVASQSKNNSNSAKCSINKYLNIAGVEIPERQIIVKLNNNWTRHFLNSDFRTFLFKLYNNTLGINARVYHYNPERGPECTFCLKKKNLPADRETIQHFFWHCPTSNQSITVLSNSLLNFELTKVNFFLGTDDRNVYNDALMVIFDLIKYILWLARIRRAIPTTHSMTSDFTYLWCIILDSSKRIKSLVTNSNFVRRNRDYVR